jgi:gamma-glutamylcyclotransferase (GGCT)/AIG2-like uncharacterized protein YtfP
MTSKPARHAAPPGFFVYGTLAPGRPNGHILANVHGTWEPATLCGHLVQDGWGAALGYPALVLDQKPTDAVSGMLFTSEALEGLWEDLDKFEGDNYQRVTVNVTMANGTQRSAQTYTLRTSSA